MHHPTSLSSHFYTDYPLCIQVKNYQIHICTSLEEIRAKRRLSEPMRLKWFGKSNCSDNKTCVYLLRINCKYERIFEITATIWSIVAINTLIHFWRKHQETTHNRKHFWRPHKERKRNVKHMECFIKWEVRFRGEVLDRGLRWKRRSTSHKG